MKKVLLQLVIAVGFVSCYNPQESMEPSLHFDGTGYRPIYVSQDEMEDISISSPQALSDPGKIYLLGSYLFVNERGKGVHVIDNSDPKKPENIAFVNIRGNYDIAAKGNWLYADNGPDLLVFDISNPKAVKLSKRIASALPTNDFPLLQNIYFECADRKKGTVIGWEKVPMANRPECFR